MNKQFNIFKKSILKTILVFSFIGVSTIGAYAAEKATTTTDLNMRQNKNTNSKVLTIIPKGADVNILDFDGYWYKVEYNGKEGYSYKKFIKEYKTQDDNFNLNLKVTVDKGSNLNIRSGPSTNYKIIGKATNGQILKTTGKVGSWYKVTYNGQIAYLNENFVQVLNSKNENNTNNKDNVVIDKNSGIVTVSELNVRTGPSTNYSVISQVKKGDILNIIAKDTSTGWLKIQFKNSSTGWVSGKYVNTTNSNNIADKNNLYNKSSIETASGPVSVNAIKLNVRTGPGTSYPVISQVKMDDSLNVIAKDIDNGWLKVQVKNSSTGWVSGKYVTIATNDTVNITSKDVVVADGPAQVTVSKLNVRSGPGTNYSVISQVKKGDILAVIASVTSNDWLKIQFKDGYTGWVSGKYVTLPDLEALNLDINDPIFK